MKNYKIVIIDQIEALKKYIEIYKYNDYQNDLSLLQKLEQSIFDCSWISKEEFLAYDEILLSIDFRIKNKMNSTLDSIKAIR